MKAKILFAKICNNDSSFCMPTRKPGSTTHGTDTISTFFLLQSKIFSLPPCRSTVNFMLNDMYGGATTVTGSTKVQRRGSF